MSPRHLLSVYLGLVSVWISFTAPAMPQFDTFARYFGVGLIVGTLLSILDSRLPRR